MTVAMEIRRGRGRHPRMGGDPIGSRWRERRYLALQRYAIPVSRGRFGDDALPRPPLSDLLRGKNQTRASTGRLLKRVMYRLPVVENQERARRSNQLSSDRTASSPPGCSVLTDCLTLSVQRYVSDPRIKCSEIASTWMERYAAGATLRII